MVKALLARVGDLIPLRYLLFDGYFGHNHALQMTQQCGLFLISKLRVNTALYFPSTRFPYAGRGRLRIYGQRFNPQQIDAKYRVSTETHENITTEVYQAKLCHRGVKYFRETLKILPQKLDPIVINQIAERLGSIGAIHHTPAQPNTS